MQSIQNTKCHVARLLSSPQYLEQIWSTDSPLCNQYLCSTCKQVFHFYVLMICLHSPVICYGEVHN